MSLCGKHVAESEQVSWIDEVITFVMQNNNLLKVREQSPDNNNYKNNISRR